MHIKDWIKYHTQIWNDEHEKIAFKIASELVWYRPHIRKKILKEVERALNENKKSTNTETAEANIPESGQT